MGRLAGLVIAAAIAAGCSSDAPTEDVAPTSTTTTTTTVAPPTTSTTTTTTTTTTTSTTAAPFATELDAEVGDFVFFFTGSTPHADEIVGAGTLAELEPDLIPAPYTLGLRGVVRLDSEGTQLAVFVRSTRAGCWQVASVSVTVEPERVVLGATGGGYDEYIGCDDGPWIGSFLIIDVPGGVGDRIIVQDECGYDGCLAADGSSEQEPARSVLVGCHWQGSVENQPHWRWADRIETCNRVEFEEEYPVFADDDE